MFDTVIVSGGSLHREFALSFIQEAKRRCREAQKELLLIAADRGLDFFRQTGLLPGLAVGDFDSLSAEGLLYLETLQESGESEVVRLCPEKDDSDTQHAVQTARERGARSIAILGATGNRIDHLMANLGLLLSGDVTIVDPFNIIAVVASGTRLVKEEQTGSYVSFFPLAGPVRGLTLEGFRYPLAGYDLSLADCGLTVSNEITSATAVITYTSGTLLMIRSRDKYRDKI